jgi:hypothetical protein
MRAGRVTGVSDHVLAWPRHPLPSPLAFWRGGEAAAWPWPFRVRARYSGIFICSKARFELSFSMGSRAWPDGMAACGGFSAAFQEAPHVPAHSRARVTGKGGWRRVGRGPDDVHPGTTMQAS